MSTPSISAIVLVAVLAGCASVPASKDVPSASAKVEAPVTEVVNVELNERSERLFNGAVGAMKAGQLGQAEQLFRELTEREPNLSTPWVNLALVYIEREDRDQAQQALARAVEINPGNCPAHNQIGILAREQGDFLGAEASYLACIERVPEFRDAYLNLGILYELYLGRLADALLAYRQYEALSAEPDRRVRGWVMDLERRLGT